MHHPGKHSELLDFTHRAGRECSKTEIIKIHSFQKRAAMNVEADRNIDVRSSPDCLPALNEFVPDKIPR